MQVRKFMEYVWLTVAGVSAGFAVDAVFRYGWKEAKNFLLFVAISLFMYWWRRSLRQKEEQEQ